MAPRLNGLAKRTVQTKLNTAVEVSSGPAKLQRVRETKPQLFEHARTQLDFLPVSETENVLLVYELRTRPL